MGLSLDRIICLQTNTEWGIQQAIELRHQVFIEELERDRTEESDFHDDNAIHVIGYIKDGGEMIAALRLYEDSRYLEGTKIGRVAVKKDLRGLGIGKKLMLKAHEIAQDLGYQYCCLHAECSQRGFYERLGYVTEGEEFQEAGKSHILMKFLLPDYGKARVGNDQFCNFLRRLLDDTQFLSRRGWAESLGVSVEDLKRWVGGEAIPRPDRLWILIRVLEDRNLRDRDHLLKDFDEMAKIPADQVSSLGSKMMPTIGDYKNRSGIDAFVEELKEKHGLR